MTDNTPSSTQSATPPSGSSSTTPSNEELKALLDQDLLDSENINSVDKINRETARLHWTDVEPHFASGNVISIDRELDLIVVAKAVADDDALAIKQWMDAKQVIPTNDEQAIEWQQSNAEFWAVVIKPLILIQPI